MEIEFLHKRFTEKDPQLLMDHIRRMGSGEAPFFPTTLSLVYDKLIGGGFAECTPLSPGLGSHAGGRSLLGPPVPPLPVSTSTSDITPPSINDPIASSSSPQAPQ